MKSIRMSAEAKKIFMIISIFLFFQACISVVECSQKKGYHMDEYFTFCLANNETGAVNPTEIGKLYDSSYFTNYLAVEPGRQFSYRQVWVNQRNDVHPPLYYVFIHTLSSLFPGKFLPWLGFGFNILLSLLISVCLYFIYKALGNSDILSLILSFGTVLLAGMLECVLFIRMYELAMLFVLLHTLLHIKNYETTQNYFYPLLFFCSIAGALTHYYVILYMFFTGLYYGLHLLFRKKVKPFLFYVITMAAAGIATYILFPGILVHLFSTNRGMESISNAQNFGDLVERLKIFGSFINNGLFAGCFWGLILFSLFCLLVHRKKGNQIQWPPELFMLAFASLCFFLFVAKSASYKEERYIFMVYPVIFLVVIQTILILGAFEKKETRAALLLIFMLILGSHANFDFPLKYEEEGIQQSKITPYQNDTCIVVSDLGSYYRIVPSFGQLSSFAQVAFLQVDSLESLKEYGLTDLTDTVIYVQSNFSRPKDVCKTILNANQGLSDYEKLFSSEYMEVYHAW